MQIYNTKTTRFKKYYPYRLCKDIQYLISRECTIRT